ncbi:hypothetical protein BDN67DRAFT_128507 [Paxillus ammoniavirescens]|nr:hypothetical protein BDN67DRAFT_128507 [Paxillus ammoniavirescens]
MIDVVRLRHLCLCAVFKPNGHYQTRRTIYDHIRRKMPARDHIRGGQSFPQAHVASGKSNHDYYDMIC